MKVVFTPPPTEDCFDAIIDRRWSQGSAPTMELNIAPVSKPTRSPRAPPSQKKKLKGSWKKRRKEQIERAVAAKRQKRPKAKVAIAQSLQLQEFESGVDTASNHETKASVEPETTEAGRASKKRKPPNGNKSNIIIHRTSSEPKSSDSARPRSKVSAPTTDVKNSDKYNQTPAAISNTLAVIGTELEPNQSKPTPTTPSLETAPPVHRDGGDKETTKTVELQDFSKTSLYRSVSVHVTERMGFQYPTEVQREVLKATLDLPAGKLSVDLLVRSPTGSGKTLAYLLPIAHYLLNRSKRTSREEGALAIIVVPTRELADQVAEDAQRLFRPWHWIVIGSVVGGESRKREKSRLRKGVNVLVATPGRLLDHMCTTQSFLYRACEFLVLDEADRLLDLGFEAEVKEIITNLNKEGITRGLEGSSIRSNFLLSATLRKDIEKLAKYSLHDPIELSIAAQTHDSQSRADGEFSMPLELQQHFCIVEQKHRLVTLACFLRLRAMKDVPADNINDDEQSLPSCKIIVFFSTCDSVDFHYHLLKLTKLPTELRRSTSASASSDKLVPLNLFKLHGNHSQPDRTAALRGFRNSHRGVLLCTDVAARGLDFKGLTFAIQYDPPTGGDGEELEYTHRAGRTARMGARGDALLFLLPSERAYVGKLEFTGVRIGEISGSAALAALYPRANLSNAGDISYATRLVTSAVQDVFEKALQSHKDLKQEAVSGFQSYCRAYATHAREVRYFFHVRNLHLGHVARAFVLSDKPVEFAEMMAEIRRAKAQLDVDDQPVESGKLEVHGSKGRREVARAIADGEAQPFNSQLTDLARRRREKGRGQESFKELALEFDS